MGRDGTFWLGGCREALGESFVRDEAVNQTQAGPVKSQGKDGPGRQDLVSRVLWGKEGVVERGGRWPEVRLARTAGGSGGRWQGRGVMVLSEVWS